MPIDFTILGRNIRKRREELNISQEELGEKVLASNVHISNIENGTRAPSIDLFLNIANVLDVSADDLLIGNLRNTSSSVGIEIHELLQDCNHDEKEMLTQILIFMKELFNEFGI